MLTTTMMTLLFCLFAIFQAPVPAAPVTQAVGTRVIAQSKSWSITESQFEAIISALPDQARELFSQPDGKRKFLDDLIQMWVLADEARSKGFDQKAERKAVLGFYANNIISSDYKDSLSGENQPSDAEIGGYYKANESDYTELNMSHIMILNADSTVVKERGGMEGALPAVEARKKLDGIRARIVAGGDFAALAKEFSQDKASAEKGGEIGPIGQGTLVPEMDKAAFALKPGEMSQVVASPVAFHLLRLASRRVQDLADVKAEIKEKVAATKLTDAIAAKVKAAGITIDETYFKKQ